MRRSIGIIGAMSMAMMARPREDDLPIVTIENERNNGLIYNSYEWIKPKPQRRKISHPVIQLEMGTVEHFESPQPLSRRAKRRAKGRKV